MNKYTSFAIIVISSLFVSTLATLAPAQAASDQAAQKTCRNQVATIHKRPAVLDKEYYGASRTNASDGGLQQIYSTNLKNWTNRYVNYSSWIYKSNNQRAVDTKALQGDIVSYEDQKANLETTYKSQVSAFAYFSSEIKETAATTKAYCATAENRASATLYYQALQGNGHLISTPEQDISTAGGRTGISAQRKAMAKLGTRIKAELTTAKNQRDAVVRSRQVKQERVLCIGICR